MNRQLCFWHHIKGLAWLALSYYPSPFSSLQALLPLHMPFCCLMNKSLHSSLCLKGSSRRYRIGPFSHVIQASVQMTLQVRGLPHSLSTSMTHVHSTSCYCWIQGNGFALHSLWVELSEHLQWEEAGSREGEAGANTHQRELDTRNFREEWRFRNVPTEKGLGFWTQVWMVVDSVYHQRTVRLWVRICAWRKGGELARIPAHLIHTAK